MIKKFFLPIIVLIAVSYTPTSFAQTRGSGITVTPVVDEFTVKPGEVLTRTVRVINPGAEVVTLYPRVLDFLTDNEKGQPVFYTTKDRSSKYALSQWVTAEKPFVRVAPNEDEPFALTITVPTGAEPGGHYGAILFSTEEPKLDEDETQIGVVGMVGTLLLASVPGKITQRLTLDEFEAPRFLISAPAKFSLLFGNTGNVHQKPEGEIKIRNWSGSASATLKVNEGGGNVLPESKRRFENQWQFDWKTIGRFTATAVVTYGSPEQQLTSSRSFYIIPLWLIIALAVLILVMFWIIARKKRQPRSTYTNSVPPPPSGSKPPRIVMR